MLLVHTVDQTRKKSGLTPTCIIGFPPPSSWEAALLVRPIFHQCPSTSRETGGALCQHCHRHTSIISVPQSCPQHSTMLADLKNKDWCFLCKWRHHTWRNSLFENYELSLRQTNEVSINGSGNVHRAGFYAISYVWGCGVKVSTLTSMKDPTSCTRV